LQENDGFSPGNSVKNYRKNRIFGFLKRMGLPWLLPALLFACAAPATRMKCDEISYRINHETLSDDQKGFMEEELKDCQQQVQEAGQKDSSSLNGLENSLSPSSKSGTGSGDSL
jgi:hypothetical protein